MFKKRELSLVDKPNFLELVSTILFGWFGLHRFIKKDYKNGFIFLFTFGLFTLGWLFDIVSLFIYLLKWKQHFEVKEINSSKVNHQEINKNTNKKITFTVAGTSYRENNIQSLGIFNSDFKLTKQEILKRSLQDAKIYKFRFSKMKVNLIDEPDNEYDQNAIKVMFNGIHVGYIKKGSQKRIKNILSEDKYNYYGEVIGGPYKILEDSGDSYNFYNDHRNFGCRIIFEPK